MRCAGVPATSSELPFPFFCPLVAIRPSDRRWFPEPTRTQPGNYVRAGCVFRAVRETLGAPNADNKTVRAVFEESSLLFFGVRPNFVLQDQRRLCQREKENQGN